MRYIKLFESIKRQTARDVIEHDRINKICKSYSIKNYTINDDYSIDVEGDVKLDFFKLEELPLKFNHVSGNFDCSYNRLTTLNGSPITIGGTLMCSYNNLTSLKWCPIKLSGLFCANNKITSLEGSPSRIDGSFDCDMNLLTTLEGGPDYVKFNYYCSNNHLVSLKGSPSFIGKSFNCSINKLKSINGASTGIQDDFIYMDGNDTLPDEILDNYEIIKYIIELQDEFMIWNSNGDLNKHNFQELLMELKKIRKVKGHY